MSALRVVILWHQHQPFYKDLVTGAYRLPWVRLHALKDYYGMVKLLDEFPDVHQTFNLVPSLVTQVQEYVSGGASDPFFDVAAKPAADLTVEDRQFALRYLFQAHPVNMVGRYPRYRELWERFRGLGESPEKAEKYFQTQDFTDLQVLSQLAWFDEYFLNEPEIAELVNKGRDFSRTDQSFVIARERALMAKALPAHAEAAKRGSIEISTSPFYHPILPLVCDTDAGAASSPGLPLPQKRFRHPEDAAEQIKRGLDLHEKVFGLRPRGMWPSEGSVSEEAIVIAHKLGVNWMASDEGVLGRTLGVNFARDARGDLPQHLGEKLYTIHRYEKDDTRMNLIFRDHTISDLIGFVYSGMDPQEAANHLVHRIKSAAQGIVLSGRDAVVPIILDGENAWEHYPKSGREFLRRFYDKLQRDPEIEAVTISEAIARHKNFSTLNSLVPGSWIDANFNVWIGAPEDNRSWDYLSHARNFYEQVAPSCVESQRKLAYEELLIAEGSDWNWWYGPEHHTANDRDFDELYRKHLSNVYQALGGTPPDYLSQPISSAAVRPHHLQQSAFIRPGITGDLIRYFEWMGAATYTADDRSGAMHGKVFLLDSMHAGIDEANLYARLDFLQTSEAFEGEVVANIESWAKGATAPASSLRLAADIKQGKIESWALEALDQSAQIASSAGPANSTVIAFRRSFEFRLPLSLLPGQTLRLRFSLWQNRLPMDALPVEGWMELQVISEEEMASTSV